MQTADSWGCSNWASAQRATLQSNYSGVGGKPEWGGYRLGDQRCVDVLSSTIRDRLRQTQCGGQACCVFAVLPGISSNNNCWSDGHICFCLFWTLWSSQVWIKAKSCWVNVPNLAIFLSVLFPPHLQIWMWIQQEDIPFQQDDLGKPLVPVTWMARAMRRPELEGGTWEVRRIWGEKEEETGERMGARGEQRKCEFAGAPVVNRSGTLPC